jgi:DNA-binding ferritin-like protein (Dps family)
MEVTTMEKQTKMMESFLVSHREFMANLDKSLALLEKNVGDATDLGKVCTDEWCSFTEDLLDDLAKMVYSISEPRWVTDQDSKKLKGLRQRVHDLYANYKKVKR